MSHTNTAPLGWTPERTRALFNILEMKFGAHPTWSDAHTPKFGTTKELDTTLACYAKLMKTSIEDVRSKFEWAITKTSEELNPTEAFAWMSSKTYADEVGFIDESYYPDLQ